MTVEITALIDATVATVAAHADELTALDQAIGDGDHGINMQRGFDAIAAARDELGGMVPGVALQKAGMTLVMKVGGAAGPLYGSLFMAMGKALPEDPGMADLARALAEGVQAVKNRGRSDVGEKTLLDVLAPVSETCNGAVADAVGVGELLDRITATARSGLASTQPMRATKGRAAFLGERSIGHLDPGARSSCLLVEAVCRCFEADGHG